MSFHRTSNPSTDRLKETCRQYLAATPPPHPAWPPDVQVVFRAVMAHVLDEGITAKALLLRCGLRDHNVYSRFKHYVGLGIKAIIVRFRMRFARLLLRDEEVPIAQIAQAVGYRSPGGFSATFRRHWGCSPTAYREHTEG